MYIKKGVEDSHIHFYAVWDGLRFNSIDSVLIQDESGWYKNWNFFFISNKVNHKKLEAGITYFVSANKSTLKVDKVFKEI